MSLLQRDVSREGSRKRQLTDAVLCAEGLVTTPLDLTLLAEHRRGHGPATRHDVGKTVKRDEPRKKTPQAKGSN